MSVIVPRCEAMEHNLTRYFTGKPCVRGHVAERYVTSGICLECHRLHNRGLLHAVPLINGRTQRPLPRPFPRPNVATDFSYMTESQIEAWYEKVRAIKPNRFLYKHHPLEELPIVWSPPLRARLLEKVK